MPSSMDRIFLLSTVLIISASCRGQNDDPWLTRNKKLVNYIVERENEVVETILRGGPGSTQLLSQVSEGMLTYSTQTWFRCSRENAVSRDVFTRSLLQGTIPSDVDVRKAMCAFSCYVDRVGLVKNGKLDKAMLSLLVVTAYGDDRDIHQYAMHSLNQCNRSVAAKSDKDDACYNAIYYKCILDHMKKANLYTPPIMSMFSLGWIKELSAEQM